MNLYGSIKAAITQQDIPAGSTLPPTRILADYLGISRSTVIKAYELLTLEGYVHAKSGSGYRIKEFESVKTVHSEQHLSLAYPKISRIGRSFLKNVVLINSTSDKSIAFRPGLPPLDIFPVNQWKNLTNLYWRHINSSALSYSPSSGIDPLKKSIAAYLNISRNLKCDYRQIIIVSGSLQSLFLIGSVLLDQRDVVVMENPTFPNVHSIFKSLKANIRSVGIDSQGLQVDALTDKLHGKAKLIHTTPSIHYPTRVRMSLERRLALLNWSSKHSSLIIENDYEHEISNWHHHIPSIFSLDTEGRTIYMGTFNRLLHPSIRLGYMVVPFYLLDAVEALQQHSHRFVSPSTQIVMHQFIEKKYLYNHIKNVVAVSSERKGLFLNTFEELFGNKVSIQTDGADSLYLLANWQDGPDDKKVAAMLEKANIIAHAYSKCFIDQNQQNGLILGYASVRNPVIKQTLPRMARLWQEGVE
ncbi:MAG: PLP-dependent aminotransferase family protein [Bacteroidota bacterium]